MTAQRTTITIEAIVDAPLKKVWQQWTDPKQIVRWNNASADWHTTRAENDLKEGGRFLSRMEAKDGSVGFNFSGQYTKVENERQIEYVMDDGRKAAVSFSGEGNKTKVTESFEAEDTNSIELQRDGWQSILNNFKKHVESSGSAEPLHFEISINAPADKVYNAMLDESTYREWTAAFNPTSHFEGSWEKGSKIIFIGTDEKGNKGGMVSRVKENIPGKYLSIEHRGILQGDNEITSGPEVEEWAGALENYSFTNVDGNTLLAVDMDSNENFRAYFEETWPKALDKLKAICEA